MNVRLIGGIYHPRETFCARDEHQIMEIINQSTEHSVYRFTRAFNLVAGTKRIFLFDRFLWIIELLYHARLKRKLFYQSKLISFLSPSLSLFMLLINSNCHYFEL